MTSGLFKENLIEKMIIRIILKAKNIPTGILFFCLFNACENDLEKVSLITSNQNLPSETAQKVEILYSDSAKIKLKLSAPVLNHYSGENPYVEFPNGVDALLYGSNGKVETHLKANYAIRYEKSNMMEAKNNVVVVNSKGEQLNSEQLFWDEKKALIYSDVFVKITTKDEIIMGEGLESNQDFSKYTFKKIKGTIQIKK